MPKLTLCLLKDKRIIIKASPLELSSYDFLHHLKLKNFQNRRVAVMENGSWAPTAGRVMRSMLEGMKNMDIVEPMVTIRSRMKEEDIPVMEEMAAALLA